MHEKSKIRLMTGMASLVLSAAAFVVTLQPAWAQSDEVTISVVLAMSGNEWSAEVQAGANAAADEFEGKVKLRFSGPPAIDPPRQAQMFLSELDTNPDAIVVVNVAPPLFTQPAMEAAARDVQVLWINVPPTNEVENALLVSANAYGMGVQGGNLMADKLEEALGVTGADVKGEVVTGICEIGLTVVENRLAGHTAALKERFPNVTILDKFKSESDRSRNFALWDEAIRTHADALAYVDPCEQGEVNIPLILKNEGRQLPFVSYDTPEEVRAGIADGTITAAIPSNFFMQAYLAVHLAADSQLNGTELASGWLEVPTVRIDQSNIEAYSAAWEHPETGLREFYADQLATILDDIPAELPETDAFVNPVN